MVAEEEDVVGVRRGQISGLSSEAYAELERFNIQRLSTLPIVKKEGVKVKTGTGTSLNATSIRVTLTCGKQWFLQCGVEQYPMQRCSAEIPTIAQAAEVLTAKLLIEHGACIEYLSSTAASTSTANFNQTLLQGQVEQRRTEAEAIAAEGRLADASRAEYEAVHAREAAETEAKALRAAADALRPPTVSHKKQKTASPSASTSMPGSHSTPEPPSPPEWMQWSLDRWRKHETETQNRRLVPLDPFIGPLPVGVIRGSKPESEPRVIVDGYSTWAPGTHGNASLPRGDEKRGWRSHQRRGVYGNLLSWASGNRTNIAIMLAESARHFGVVDEVSMLYWIVHLHLPYSIPCLI